MTITRATKPLFCFFCTYFQQQVLTASQDDSPCIHQVHYQMFLFCLELYTQSCAPIPMPTSSPLSSCFLLDLYIKNRKRINLLASTDNTPLNLFLIPSPDERLWRGDKRGTFFFLFQLISISFKSE